jgi:hypothetical protein
MRKEYDNGYIDYESYTPIGDYDEEGDTKYRIEAYFTFEDKKKSEDFLNYLYSKISEYKDF